MVSVSAGAPGYGTPVKVQFITIRLAFDAHVHYLIAADHANCGARVPRPHRDRFPTFHFETFAGGVVGICG